MSNPYFKHAERAPFELGVLLRSLPKDLDSASAPISAEQHDRLMAADEHAENYASNLLMGLESLGRVLRCATTSTVSPPRADDIGGIGTLVTEIAIQLQFIEEFRIAVSSRNLASAFSAGKGASK